MFRTCSVLIEVHKLACKQQLLKFSVTNITTICLILMKYFLAVWNMTSGTSRCMLSVLVVHILFHLCAQQNYNFSSLLLTYSRCLLTSISFYVLSMDFILETDFKIYHTQYHDGLTNFLQHSQLQQCSRQVLNNKINNNKKNYIHDITTHMHKKVSKYAVLLEKRKLCQPPVNNYFGWQ